MLRHAWYKQRLLSVSLYQVSSRFPQVLDIPFLLSLNGHMNTSPLRTDAIRTARHNLLRDLAAIHAAAINAKSKNSAHMTGLRILLIIAQGGICAGCGNSLAGVTVEVCHINPSSNSTTGYEVSPGNVYAGCKACNTYERGMTGAQIVASMARPDVVQREHPTRTACLAASAPYAFAYAEVIACRSPLM